LKKLSETIWDEHSDEQHDDDDDDDDADDADDDDDTDNNSNSSRRSNDTNPLLTYKRKVKDQFVLHTPLASLEPTPLRAAEKRLLTARRAHIATFPSLNARQAFAPPARCAAQFAKHGLAVPAFLLSPHDEHHVPPHIELLALINRSRRVRRRFVALDGHPTTVRVVPAKRAHGKQERDGKDL
jgi:hypothetical protein